MSAEAMLVLVFPESQSSNYGLIQSMVRHLPGYTQIAVGNKLINIVAFAKTPADATLALVVYNACRNWKGAMCFARGRLITNHSFFGSAIECYAKTAHCASVTEYCRGTYDYPCREMQRHTYYEDKWYGSAEQTWRRVQAVAVKYDADVCPLLASHLVNPAMAEPFHNSRLIEAADDMRFANDINSLLKEFDEND
jgi:hypothetical protein